MISIIVPVYNVENYLKSFDECIQCQTYKDYEVIYVDDGSTDHSGIILDEMAVGRTNYKVIHKINGNSASARNEGLRHAKGEWITFIDSDDRIECDYLESLIGQINDDVDYVIGGHIRVNDNNEPIGKVYPNVSFFITRKKALLQIYCPKYFWGGFVWGKLYRSDIIKNNGLFFDEKQRIIEDGIFSVQYILHSHKGFFFTKPIYRYNVGRVSSLSHINTDQKREEDFDAWIKMCNIIRKSSFNSIECRFRAQWTVYVLYRRLLRYAKNTAGSTISIEDVSHKMRSSILYINRLVFPILFKLRY